MASQFARRASVALGANESDTSGIAEVDDAQETSSIQRESSEIESRWSLEEWPSVKPLVTSSSFSEEMSDRVTVDQQRREEQNAMALNRDDSAVSEEFIRTGGWIQNNRGELTSSLGSRQWPNSNRTAGDVTAVRAG